MRPASGRSDAHETIGRDAGARGGKPQSRRIRGAVGSDSRVRLASGRKDGNAKRHGGGCRPWDAQPPRVLQPSQAVRSRRGGRQMEGVMHLWTTGGQENTCEVACCRKPGDCRMVREIG